MIDPIVVEFDVRSSSRHAFEMWTSRTSMWWPKSHTVTRDPALTVVFEPFEGGRIFERGSDGSEHEWGEVLFWDPPNRIGYFWHLFFDRGQATEVNVTFTDIDGGCRVRLEQTGVEKLGGEAGADRRRRTNHAWLELTESYREAIGRQ